MVAMKNWSSSHSETASKHLLESPRWNGFRRKALAAFESQSFPEFKYGLDIRSDVSRINWESFVFDFSSAEKYMQELGDGAILCDLATAFEKFPEKLEAHLGKQLHLEKKMESLHAAFLSSGIFIYLPKNVHLSSPIHLSCVLGKYSRVEHVLILAEENSSASIIQDVHSDSITLSSPVFYSSMIEVVAKPNASIRIGRLQDLASSNVFHFFISRAEVEANASVHLEWGEFGAELAKAEHATTLLSPHASSSNVGVVLGAHAQQLDLLQSVRHISPYTRSELLARGCLDESAKCIYNGLIRMEKEAIASQGKQACDLLLLSPQAEADPVPSLEILNSDVKCSHAATVGRLDKEKLFYVSSRGVSEEVARSMVIAGFYENMLSHFILAELKTKCQSLLEKRLRLNAHAFDATDMVVQGVNV